MNQEYLNLLACIRCKKSNLSIVSNTTDGKVIKEGLIQCNDCDAIYPIIDEIPCFLPTDRMNSQIREQLSVLKSTLLNSVKE